MGSTHQVRFVARVVQDRAEVGWRRNQKQLDIIQLKWFEKEWKDILAIDHHCVGAWPLLFSTCSWRSFERSL